MARKDKEVRDYRLLALSMMNARGRNVELNQATEARERGHLRPPRKRRPGISRALAHTQEALT
jgi:hypothetical protein